MRPSPVAKTTAPRRPNLSTRTMHMGHARLSGDRRDARSLLAFAGPAVIASVAYMDPGNFATNIQAGAQYNYNLLWVVVVANIVAMLFQALSAKVGIVTGHNLPELCRQHFPRPVVLGMWAVSEIAAMATDLAEFLGGAIGVALLFDIPLFYGLAVTGVITYALLTLEAKGFRPVELMITALVLVIGLSYIVELILIPPDWHAAAFHAVVPRLDDANAMLLAVGIIGATVMPHAIYLHSGLTQNRILPRNDKERRRLLRLSNREVLIALGFAGAVNMAMVMMAAAAFHAGHSDIAEIESAYHTLIPLLGHAAAGVFLLSLIASGLSSSAVGTMAGQLIMQGFIKRRIPIWLRRLVTMAPAFIVVAYGVNATKALVLSQVILSLTLPVPMLALLLLTRQKKIMGDFATRGFHAAIILVAATIVLALNLMLVLQMIGVQVLPG